MILGIPLENLAAEFLLFGFTLDVMNSCQVLPEGMMHDGMCDCPFIRVVESVHMVRSRTDPVIFTLTLTSDSPSRHLVFVFSYPLLYLPKSPASPS